MSKHMVKCPICGETFDANVEPYVMVSNNRRYAHKKCYNETKDKEDKIKNDKLVLENYIKELFGYKTLPEKVNRQIKQYIKDKNYSYSGIYKTLKYWFDVKNGDIAKANGGIGIVPYVYDEAFLYWRGIWEARERNKEKILYETSVQVQEVHILPPKRKPMKHFRKLFTFLEEEEEQKNEQ